MARVLVRFLGVPVATVMEGLLRLTALRAGVALAYHSLAEQGGDPAVELVPPHSRSLFEGQMEHLARRYRVVLAAELPSAVEARRRGERFPVAVTFDDDLASHVHFALPVLQRAGLHATYFLTGTSLDRPFAFWWERLQRACDAAEAQVRELVGRVSGRESREPLSIHATGRLVESLEPRERDRFAEALLEAAGPDPPDAGMRAADVRTLIAAGMEIGFHTRRHDPLTTLPDDLLAEALCTGRQELEALVGGPLRMIAYPHGKADPRVGQAAREASFALGYTTAPRSVRPTSDRFLLGRVNPSYRSVGHLALQIVFALARAHR